MAAKYDYSAITATAKRLIDKFGRTTTLKQVTDSGTEWNPTQTSVEVSITAVFTNYAKNEIDGTLILATDKKVLTYDAVTLSDLLIDESIEYNVISVQPINPGDTKIIYKVQLRR